jgi:prevent-host-death family protein
MRHRTIPQRELRNDIAAVLREAEAGTEFTVTVRGRPVARLGPVEGTPRPRRYVDRETLLRIFRESPVDEGWAADLADLRAFQRSADDPRADR